MALAERSGSPPDVATVRRAILPWNRKTPDSARFNYVPERWKRDLDGTSDPVSAVVTAVLFPLWLPALFVALGAVLECLIAILISPFALLYRFIRRRWPVDVLDRRNRLLGRRHASSWRAAGDLSRTMRAEHAETLRGMGRSGFLITGAGAAPDPSRYRPTGPESRS